MGLNWDNTPLLPELGTPAPEAARAVLRRKFTAGHAPIKKKKSQNTLGQWKRKVKLNLNLAEARK